MILMKRLFLKLRLREFVMKNKHNRNFLFLFIILGILLFGMFSNYKKKWDRDPSILKISKILETNSIAQNFIHKERT